MKRLLGFLCVATAIYLSVAPPALTGGRTPEQINWLAGTFLTTAAMMLGIGAATKT
jgi:hypothetical protein